MLIVNPWQSYTSSCHSTFLHFPFNFSFQPGGSLSPKTKFNLIVAFHGLAQFQTHMQCLLTQLYLLLEGGCLSTPSFPHLKHAYYRSNLGGTIMHKASQHVTSVPPNTYYFRNLSFLEQTALKFAT